MGSCRNVVLRGDAADARSRGELLDERAMRGEAELTELERLRQRTASLDARFKVFEVVAPRSVRRRHMLAR
jgi:hypothetical protein